MYGRKPKQSLGDGEEKKPTSKKVSKKVDEMIGNKAVDAIGKSDIIESSIPRIDSNEVVNMINDIEKLPPSLDGIVSDIDELELERALTEMEANDDFDIDRFLADSGSISKEEEEELMKQLENIPDSLISDLDKV